jgi:hypothetical protein
MTWHVARDYASFNSAAEALMRRAGWPYVFLRPPAVSRPLLVLADQTRAPGLEEEYQAWAATPEAAVVDAAALRARAGAEVEDYFQLPEREDLLRCKWFAAAAQTPVAMYAASTYGGVVEFEWSWLFAPGVERAMVMVRRHREYRVTQRGWLLFRRTVSRRVVEPWIIEINGGAVTERPCPHQMAVFEESARHLGVHAPGGRFLPHTRGFDTKPYHVLPPRKRGMV